MKLKQVPGGNLLLGRESLKGFITTKDFFGHSGVKSGRVAIDKHERPHLYVHTLKQGVPKVFKYSGSQFEENGDEGFSFSKKKNHSGSPIIKEANKPSEVVRELGKNRGSARSHYGEMAFDGYREDLMFSTHDDWVGTAKKLWRDIDGKGRYTILTDFDLYYLALMDESHGYVINISSFGRSPMSKVYLYKLNGVKNENDKRYDLYLSQSNRIAIFHHENDDVSEKQARSYAKSLLDHVNIQ